MPWTLLHDAVQNGSTARVEQMLKDGQEVDPRDESTRTPLHIACQYASSFQCMGLLLEHGADPSAKTDEGATPLHYAAQSGSIESVELLLSYSNDVNTVDKQGRIPEQWGRGPKLLRILRDARESTCAPPGDESQEVKSPWGCMPCKAQKSRPKLVSSSLEKEVQEGPDDCTVVPGERACMPTRACC